MLRHGVRLCLAVLLIGFSLLAVTVIRTNSVPRLLNFGNEAEGVTCGWVLYSEFLMFDRDFSVSVRANNTVSVYILDETAVKQWNVNKTVNAAWSYEDVVEGRFSERSRGRGGYAVLVYLPQDGITVIKVIFTFSGFEKDLLMTSLTMVGVGALLLAITVFVNMGNKSRRHKQPKHDNFANRAPI